jgi:CubicO group peptidase (beta-lactamase class C family)
MLGGVSGHAGLFASAREVATIMQMLLQGGYYGDRRYLQESTIREFTSRHPRSTRRALGFDMFQLDNRFPPNFSPLASKQTFGHTGFTGACTWADPENNIVYVFLANRTFPSMRNYKLNKMEVRPRIQTAIYEAMRPAPEEEDVQIALPYPPKTEPLPVRKIEGRVASGQ